MELYDVSSYMEQNLLRVLVELRIILDHGIDGINLQGTARMTVKPTIKTNILHIPFKQIICSDE